MTETLRKSYFVASLVCIGFLARLQAILPGYAVDDYIHFEKTTNETYHLVAAQGRWGSALLLRVLDLFQLSWAQTYVLGSVALTAVLVLFVITFMEILGIKYTILNALIFSAALVASYQTEIFTFRSATLNSAIAIVLTIGSMRVFYGKEKSSLHRLLLSTFLLTAGICFYQSVLNFAILLGLAHLVVKKSLIRQNKRTLLNALGFSYLSAAFISALLYLAITKGAQLVFGVASDSRSQLIQPDKIGERLEAWVTLLARVFIGNEPVAPVALKFLVAVNLLIAFGLVLNRKFGVSRKVLLNVEVSKFLGLILVVVVLTPGLILLFQDWWPVPRVMAHVGLAVAIAAAYLADILSHKQRSWFVPGATSVLLVSALTTQSIFIDQQKINQSDATLAAEIASAIRLVDAENEAVEIAISGNFFSHVGRPIPTMQGDLNISAFMVDWAKYPLVLSKLSDSAAKQALPNTQSAAARECLSRKSWPAEEAVFVLDQAVVVCLTGLK